jgi:adenosylcobinamide-GDP ribazoletransferase
MRRGDVGPMGVVALIIVLGLQAVSVGELITGASGALLVGAAVCSSRAALCLTCVRGVPAARDDGLGVAVADSVPRAAAAGTWLAVLLTMTEAAWLSGHNPASGTLATVAAAVMVGLLIYRCVRRLGGVTGDVMGAAIEIAFTVMITVLII